MIRTTRDVWSLAKSHGIAHAEDYSYQSCFTRGEWNFHECFDGRLISRTKDGIELKHFLLHRKRCKNATRKTKVACYVLEEGDYRLDRIHGLGECPYCEYRTNLIP